MAGTLTQEDGRGRMEDIECPILNARWIQVNQDVMKGMGGNSAEVRSPGLKVQVVRTESQHNTIYCERCITRHPEYGLNFCELRNTKCIYSVRR